MDRDEIIVLRKFGNQIEANIVKTKLDAFDIPCFLTEENLTQLTTPLLSGGIRLHIFAADQERAIEILEKINVAKMDEDSIMQCPHCHSKKILGNHKDSIHTRMSKAITDTLLGLSKPYYCLDCGEEFDN